MKGVIEMTQSLTLKACRVNVGLSQETAATKLGISKETLSNYERGRSEEHTSELQSQSVISYAVFCLKKIFFNDTATTEIYTICYTLSLHDALPIWLSQLILFITAPFSLSLYS